MNPQRDTRLWWDGVALAAWDTCNTYGVTFALSSAQRENLDLLQRILAWAKDHMRALSPDGVPPEEFSTGCFASPSAACAHAGRA